MREENIAKIRAACIKANPEIDGKHLFEVGYARCKFCNIERIVRDRKVFNRVVNERSGGSSQEVEVTDYNMEGGPCPKHVSRPIRLADVLWAIKEAKHVPRGFFVNEYGMFFAMVDEKAFGDTVVLRYQELGWNLLKDDLSLQTNECAEFIANLL